jgi:hypothetical protein
MEMIEALDKGQILAVAVAIADEVSREKIEYGASAALATSYRCLGLACFCLMKREVIGHSREAGLQTPFTFNGRVN